MVKFLFFLLNNKNKMIYLYMLESLCLHLQHPNEEWGEDKILCVILLCQFLFAHAHFELHFRCFIDSTKHQWSAQLIVKRLSGHLPLYQDCFHVGVIDGWSTECVLVCWRELDVLSLFACGLTKALIVPAVSIVHWNHWHKKKNHKNLSLQMMWRLCKQNIISCPFTETFKMLIVLS